MKKILVAVLLASSIASGFACWTSIGTDSVVGAALAVADSEGGVFEDSVPLDGTQIIDRRPVRPDFEQAYRTCLLAGFSRLECYESVSEGEF